MCIATRIGWIFLLGTSCGLAAAQRDTGTTPRMPSGANAVQPRTESPAVDSQSLNATPGFEVATIKPSDPDKCCARTYSRNGRQFTFRNGYLRWLLLFAYGLNPKQVVGGPAWVDTERFDVSGELEGEFIPTDRQWKAALLQLLIDRFHITMHHEMREMPAYAVTVAKDGPKLTPSTTDVRKHSTGFSGSVGQTMHGEGTAVTVAQFFADIQRLATDKPIVDQTGLTGIYDMKIDFTREDINSLGMTQLPDTAAPNLFEAVQQQLGLKLVGTKAPVDVIVIDQAEPPGDN